MLRSLFILSLILSQGTFTIQYKGYTYGVQGDVVMIDPDKPYVPQPKIPAWITWTESIDSSWAQAQVIYGGKCDSMEFIRLPKSSGWFLKSFNGNSNRHLHTGNARQNNDSIYMGVGSFVGISFYGKRDSFVVVH